MKRKTHEEYVSELSIKNPYVKVIGSYIDSKTPIQHYCSIHDVFWDIKPASALNGCGCPKCHIERSHKTLRKSHKKYVDEVMKISPYIEVVGQYIDAKTSIEHYCKKHNVLWTASPSNILQGHGCPKCGIELSSSKRQKTHDEYVIDVKKINPDIDVVGDYRGANIPILHMCKIDNYMWYATPANILFGKGCPLCNESKGERHVRQWLEKYDIKYIYQKFFNNCKDVRPLPFDFYLPNQNVCIEYDGEQHFRPVNFDGIEDSLVVQQFNKLKQHDDIKTKYCKDNNIHLLRIPYYKNVQEELEHFLFI